MSITAKGAYRAPFVLFMSKYDLFYFDPKGEC